MNRSKVRWFVLLAGVAVCAAVLGGCSPGPREQCMAAREATIASESGSTEVAYFQVIEELPRTSLQTPTTATASAEWISGR